MVYHLLSSSNYVSVSESANIVRKAVRASFDEYGESVAESLLANLSDIHALPVDTMLVDYGLLEQSIRQLFGYGSELIISGIKKNLMDVMPGINPTLTTGQMINQILEAETTKFLRHLPSSEHIVLLHNSKEVKDRMISAFLDSTDSRGVIFSDSKKYELPIQSVSYENILKREDKTKSMGDLAAWIGGVRAQGSKTRIIGQDDAWFLNNGFPDELISLEKGLGPKLDDGLSVFCTYDLQTTPAVHLHNIITSHDYILLDNPMIVYRRDIKG